jgi:hypothetical protein
VEAKALIAGAGGVGASGGEGCGWGKTLIADGGTDCSFPDLERGDCGMLATYQPAPHHGAEVEGERCIAQKILASGSRWVWRRAERRAGAWRWRPESAQMVGERDNREESSMEPRGPSKFSFHDGGRESGGERGERGRQQNRAPKKMWTPTLATLVVEIGVCSCFATESTCIDNIH